MQATIILLITYHLFIFINISIQLNVLCCIIFVFFGFEQNTDTSRIDINNAITKETSNNNIIDIPRDDTVENISEDDVIDIPNNDTVDMLYGNITKISNDDIDNFLPSNIIEVLVIFVSYTL